MKIISDDLRIKYEGPIRFFCDNTSAINIAHNPLQHDRTKHIEIKWHFIKEKLDNGLITATYVPSCTIILFANYLNAPSTIIHSFLLTLLLPTIQYSTMLYLPS